MERDRSVQRHSMHVTVHEPPVQVSSARPMQQQRTALRAFRPSLDQRLLNFTVQRCTRQWRACMKAFATGTTSSSLAPTGRSFQLRASPAGTSPSTGLATLAWSGTLTRRQCRTATTNGTSVIAYLTLVDEHPTRSPQQRLRAARDSGRSGNKAKSCSRSNTESTLTIQPPGRPSSSQV